MDNTWLDNLPEEQVIAWRRYFHKHPELSNREYKTSAYIEEVLKSFNGISVERPTETSVLGVLKGTGENAENGKTVMLRADIDALPVPDETGTEYASVNQGVSHACGHDTHTAMLLGTAKILSENTDLVNGTILFIFQHAEEMPPGGAMEIVNSPVMAKYKVDGVFGLHIMTNQKAGLIKIIEEGPVTTAADGFKIKIKGKGAHGSMPDTGIDPILTGSQLVVALNTIVSRNIKPGEFGVVSIGTFISGVANNVIPDTAELTGSIRSTKESVRNIIEDRVRTITDSVCKTNGADYEISYTRFYSPINNHKEMATLSYNAIKKVNGEEFVELTKELSSGSEDFTSFEKLAPTCYMFLGGGSKEEGYIYSNHNPKFNIVEDVLIQGVKAEVQIALDFLNQGN